MTAYAAAPELKVIPQRSADTGTYTGKNVRRKKKTKRVSRILFALACIIAIFLVGFFIGSHVNKVSSSSAAAVSERDVTYQSVKVSEGDTLWTLADEYMNPAYESKSEFIEEIMQINNVYDGTIHAGSYLLIPTDASGL